MKKLLSFLLFVVLPLTAVVPGFMGWQTQQFMDATATQINTMPGYKAHWQNYKRGWFTSQGVLLVEVLGVEDLLPDGESATLPILFNLRHGPVLFDAAAATKKISVGWFSLAVGLDDKYENYLKNLLEVAGDGAFYELKARMNLMGVTQISDRWLPFSFYAKHFTVVAESYQGNGVIGTARQLSYAFTLPDVRIIPKESTQAFVLHGLSASVLVELAPLQRVNMAPGKITAQIQSIQWPANNIVFEGMQLNANTWLNTEQTNFNTRTGIAIDSLTIKTLDSSPFVLQNMQFEAAYLNMSLAFLAQYQALVAEAGDNPAPEFWQQQVGALALQHLLPHSPKLSVDKLAFKTYQGQFKAGLDLSVDGHAIAAANISPQNPLALLPYLIAHVDIKADRPVIKQLARLYSQQQLKEQVPEPSLQSAAQDEADKLLMMLEQQNIIKTTDDQYRLNLTYEKGQALLNGQPMPLPF